MRKINARVYQKNIAKFQSITCIKPDLADACVILPKKELSKGIYSVHSVQESGHPLYKVCNANTVSQGQSHHIQMMGGITAWVPIYVSKRWRQYLIAQGSIIGHWVPYRLKYTHSGLFMVLSLVSPWPSQNHTHFVFCKPPESN